MPSTPAKALEALRGPILNIIRKSDLNQVSAKKVRLALSETPADAMQGDVGSGGAGPRLLSRLGIDLEDKSHKKAVDELIRECYDQVIKEPNSNVRPAPSSNGSSGATPRLALPGMGGVRGSHSSTPSSSTKAAPSSSASSAKSTKRGRADVDEVYSDEEEADADTINHLAKKSKAKPAKRKSSAAVGPDGEKIKRAPNPNNPFNKPVILSEAMSQICGGKEMPRFQITKQLWAYIKERDLQDPSNRRKIRCDPPLQKLFGKDVVDSFEMAKLISPHVTKKVD